MRQEIFEILLRSYLRTFPPIANESNSMLNQAKRNALASLMFIISGCNWENVDKMTKKIMDDIG